MAILDLRNINPFLRVCLDQATYPLSCLSSFWASILQSELSSHSLVSSSQMFWSIRLYSLKMVSQPLAFYFSPSSLQSWFPIPPCLANPGRLSLLLYFSFLLAGLPFSLSDQNPSSNLQIRMIEEPFALSWPKVDADWACPLKPSSWLDSHCRNSHNIGHICTFHLVGQPFILNVKV